MWVREKVDRNVYKKKNIANLHDPSYPYFNLTFIILLKNNQHDQLTLVYNNAYRWFEGWTSLIYFIVDGYKYSAYDYICVK